MLKKLLILPVLLILAACHDTHESAPLKTVNYQKVKEAAEAKKKNFNPGFVTATHAARVYRIDNYEIRDSLITIERVTVPVMRTVAGDLPERNATGPFKVTFLAEKGDTLYHYGMQSPLYVRREHGQSKGLYKVRAGSFLVPIPPLQNIARIILEDSNGTRHESTIRIQ